MNPALLGLPPSRRGTAGITALIAQLGGSSVVPAFYDWRYAVSRTGTAVDAWDDARGAAAGGPTLTATGTSRPVFTAGSGIVFDGTQSVIRAATIGRLAECTGNCALILVTTLPTATAATQVIGCLNGATAAQVLSTFTGSGAPTTLSVVGPVSTPTVTMAGSTTIRRIAHAWNTYGGGNVTTGVQNGAGTANTATAASSNVAVTRLTLGANRADTPTSFGAGSVVAAIVFNGDWTASLRTAVNAWATAAHGAQA